MTVKDHVIHEAMKLPEAERIELVERLHESLDGPPYPGAEEAWAVEIERRIKSIDSGSAKFLAGKQARARIAGHRR